MYASLFKSLNDEGVEFLVLGGAAVCLSGFTRMTEDIDILIKNTTENVDRFVVVAAKWGEGYGADLTFEDFQGPGAVRIVEEFPLDVFTLVDGRDYEAFATNAVKHVLDGGIVVPAFSIGDLIEVKAKTLRERDESDVAILRRIQAAPPSDRRTSPIIMLEPLPSAEQAIESNVSPEQTLPDVASVPREKVEDAQKSASELKADEKDKPQK